MTTTKTKVWCVKAAADRLGWGRHTLAKAVNLGLVPYHTRPTGSTYFTDEDLKKIEEMCTHDNRLVLEA